MRKIAVGLLTVIAVFLLSVASGFGWGPDVQIYSGQINTFDVDYDLGTGTMFLAFQATGEEVIRLYSSTDHGRHWAQITTFNTHARSGTVPRADLHRLRVVYSEGKIHIFWVDSAGFLNKWSCFTTGTGHGGAQVSPFPIMEGSFSVTMDPESGNLYTAYRTDVLPGRYKNIGRYKYTLDMITVSTDDGRTWTLTYHPTGTMYQRDYSYERYCLAFAPGAENHIYAVETTSPVVDYPAPEGAPTFKQINFMRAPSVFGEPFTRWKKIAAGAVDSIDARVTAAYVNDSGVWVVYNRGGHGGDNLDLLNAYSPNGGLTWSYLDRPVAAEAGVEEYVADLKYYRDPGNSYVNMVYIRRQPGSPRQAVWAYASTADPAWRGLEAGFNDREVKGYPEDVGPRLVYSPGAEVPGSGVVFSYRGANREASGLYFDAPWIVAAGGFLPVYPELPVYPVYVTHKLTVTIHGSGSVVSSPAGLDCTNDLLTGDKVCSHNFNEGTAVALTAMAIDGSGYSSHFTGWSGDCTGTAPCPLVMNGDKSVEANFGALGTPVFALPVPAGQQAWDYPPVENPLLQSDPANCKPFAVGDLMTGNLNIQVGLPPFSAGVDVYLAIEYAGSLFLINSSNELKLSSTLTELPRWKTDVNASDINESLYGNISLALLPTGLYNLYIAVVPTGETDFSHYYFWSSYFLAP